MSITNKMEDITTLSNQRIFSSICWLSKELLFEIKAISTQKTNNTLNWALVNIVKIDDNSEEFSYADSDKILALLATIFNKYKRPNRNDTNYEIQLKWHLFCDACIHELTSLHGLEEYIIAKELSFCIADFHNKNTQCVGLRLNYRQLLQSHTLLMTNAVLYYMQIRYRDSNNFLRADEELVIIIFLNAYYDLLPWFGDVTLWSKFHFCFYRRCLKLDTEKMFFYDPENYINHVLNALYKKEHGHNAMEILKIALRRLDYNTFMRFYFNKFTSNYNACSDDEVHTSYNYNLLHYVLPAIIDAYPNEVIDIIEMLPTGRPFFEDLVLVALTIAIRRKLISFDWCLNDNMYYNLQVCQGWIAERTLIAIICEIADSKNIVICFTLLRRFMSGSTYQRLCSVRFLHLLDTFMAYVKSFVSKTTGQKNANVQLKNVSAFLAFILEYSKAHFKESEYSKKQYYYDILQQTWQNLPDFFCTNPKKVGQKQVALKTCARYSAKHFLYTLKQCDNSKLSIDEEIDCYLEILIKHNQLHHIEHALVIDLLKYSNNCSVHITSSHVLAATLTVYRKILEANMLSRNCIKAENIERIIVAIVPRQCDADPNIFVDMDARLERAVIVRLIQLSRNCLDRHGKNYVLSISIIPLNICSQCNKHKRMINNILQEGMKIISLVISESVEYCRGFNTVDYLRLCEHIIEYGPSKKLVVEISRLHRVVLNDQTINNTQCFINYVKEITSRVTGSNTHIARRAMRRHPSITETMRNTLIAIVKYEAHSDEILHVTLQNELLDYVKSAEGVQFILVTESLRVIFDTKEFPFRNVIIMEELIMHILRQLDMVLKWEIITALIQLLQGILSTLLCYSHALLFRRYQNLMIEIMSFVPLRTITCIAVIYILHILRFRDIPRIHGYKLLKLEEQKMIMLSKILYENTICADIIPDEAVCNLANDINTEVYLKQYSNETCRAITALIDHLCKDSFGN